MTKKVLLTSFDIWLPHHNSNSSDDLLLEIARLDLRPLSLNFLRKLPVDVSIASSRVIAEIDKFHPDIVICCGMAERRYLMTIESNATCGDEMLKTSVNLEKLISSSIETEISHNAGRFVCEGLYYSILKYLRARVASPQENRHLNSHCIFVHVPVLTPVNRQLIIEDFLKILKNMTNL